MWHGNLPAGRKKMGSASILRPNRVVPLCLLALRVSETLFRVGGQYSSIQFFNE